MDPTSARNDSARSWFWKLRRFGRQIGRDAKELKKGRALYVRKYVVDLGGRVG